MAEKINKGIIFKYLREGLKEIEVGSHGELMSNILKKMVDAGLIEQPRTTNPLEYYNYICGADKELEALIVECYTYLIVRGIIIPKPVTPNYGGSQAWSFFKITEYGRDWVNREEEPIPEDTSGFLNFLSVNIPGIDSIIIQYISEALNTFNGGYYFASAVMVGAASEKLIYLLSEATKKATKNPTLQKKFKTALERRRLFDLFKLISDTEGLPIVWTEKRLL